VSELAGMAECIRQAMKLASLTPQTQAHFLLDSVAAKLENESGEYTFASWEKWAALSSRVDGVSRKIDALEAKIELLVRLHPDAKF